MDLKKDYKEFSDKCRDFITTYAFHNSKCSYFNTEFCDCGYRDNIREIRKLYNILNQK